MESKFKGWDSGLGVPEMLTIKEIERPKPGTGIRQCLSAVVRHICSKSAKRNLQAPSRSGIICVDTCVIDADYAETGPVAFGFVIESMNTDHSTNTAESAGMIHTGMRLYSSAMLIP